MESPEGYIASYESQGNEWQSTCTFYSRYILRHTAASYRWFQWYCISRKVSPMLFVCMLAGIHWSERQLISHVDIFKKEILQRKGCLVMFVSTYSGDLTWNTRSLSSDDVWWAVLFWMQWLSKRRFYFFLVNQTYEPWHKRLSFPPCGPYLATSNISPNNKVNTRYNGQCSETELFSTSSG